MLTATALLAELQTKGIRLTVQGEQLGVNAPKGVLTEALRAAIRQQKPALLGLLSAPLGPEPAATPPVAGMCPQSACPCCGGARFWRSIYGVRICPRCHPPGHVSLVAEWISGSDAFGVEQRGVQ